MKTINEKYNFYSKITTVLIQQSCWKTWAFKKSVCFSSTVQKRSPKVTLIILHYSVSLGQRDKQVTNSLVSKPIICSHYFPNQVPVHIQTKKNNSNSCFMWNTSSLLELICVTLENNQHAKFVFQQHFHVLTWSLMRAPVLHLAPSLRCLKLFQGESHVQTSRKAASLSHFGSSCHTQKAMKSLRKQPDPS